MAAPDRAVGTRVVGLTGGIGADKSEVARLLLAKGADWIDADAIARDIVAPGSPALDAIVAAFGSHLLDAGGALRRKALGAIVFADKAALRRLEALTHPAIRARIAERVAAARAAGRGLVVIDAALLLELQLDRAVDLVVGVVAPESVRVRRVQERDGLDAAAVQARIANQAGESALRARADVLIDNAGDRASLSDQVDALWPRLQPAG